MNVVINNIMSSTEGTEAEKKAVLAEAKVWRAYYYWYLQSLYAKDYNESTASTDLSVPLSLTPDLEAELPRTTVEEVTRQIWSDLEGAEDYLPDVATNNYRPTKGAVYALKARILFTSTNTKKLQSKPSSLCRQTANCKTCVLGRSRTRASLHQESMEDLPTTISLQRRYGICLMDSLASSPPSASAMIYNHFSKKATCDSSSISATETVEAIFGKTDVIAIYKP